MRFMSSTQLTDKIVMANNIRTNGTRVWIKLGTVYDMALPRDLTPASEWD